MTGRAGDGVRHKAAPGVPAPPATAPTTPLDHLARSLRARASVPSGQVAPAAILWTDPKAEWRALLPAARSEIPELLALGDYRADERTGPAIWLRCVVEGAIELPDLARDRALIIYLPGSSAVSCAPARIARRSSGRSSS